MKWQNFGMLSMRSTMYNVLDVPEMMKANGSIRRRNKPHRGHGSTLLLKSGTSLDLIPEGSEIRFAYGSWEIHMPLRNKRMVKRLAKQLDAIAWLVDE